MSPDDKFFRSMNHRRAQSRGTTAGVRPVNEHQLRQQQKANARLEFFKALAAGQVHVYDRFGSVIEPGARILWHPSVDPVVEVQAVQPNPDPESPVGQMLVTLAVTISVAVAPNQPWQTFILMGAPPERELGSEDARKAAQEELGAVADRIGANGREGVRTGPTGLVDGTGRSLDEPPR